MSAPATTTPADEAEATEPAPPPPGDRTSVAEVAATISGGFVLAAGALQWLVPLCFSC